MTAPTPRKGAARRADIPPEILAQLNDGTLPAASLSEGLAIDFAVLLEAAFPEIPPESLDLVRGAASRGVTRRMELVGTLLLDHLGIDGLDPVVSHGSDTVRGWACYAIGKAPKLKLGARLARIRPLADDPHFGVREWAWLAVRPHIAGNIPFAVKLLTPWTSEPSANLRRFAVELTRPRGVWASHLAALKQNPTLGLPLLEPLRSDPARYVQDSVSNWLNDAAKSHPEWVRELCQRWRTESPSPATERICTRALRGVKST